MGVAFMCRNICDCPGSSTQYSWNCVQSVYSNIRDLRVGFGVVHRGCTLSFSRNQP